MNEFNFPGKKGNRAWSTKMMTLKRVPVDDREVVGCVSGERKERVGLEGEEKDRCEKETEKKFILADASWSELITPR
jgi:hypothetical protein